MSDSKEEKKKRSKVEEEGDEKETKDEGDESEPEAEREEEEYLPADEKKKRDTLSTSAKKLKEVAEEGNAEYDDKMELDRTKRFEFLLKQTEIFGHFMQESGEDILETRALLM